jgi:hypothetical protein
MYDLMQLYHHAFVTNQQALAMALSKITYPPESEIAQKFPISQSAQANSAAIFFIVSDFIAMKYARKHPNFKMRPIPQGILNYLRPPFNQMTSLDIEDQRRFRASLPPEQQHEVYIDD